MLVKFLGLTIDHNLIFDTDILNACEMAIVKIGNLSRIRNAFL